MTRLEAEQFARKIAVKKLHALRASKSFQLPSEIKFTQFHIQSFVQGFMEAYDKINNPKVSE